MSNIPKSWDTYQLLFDETWNHGVSHAGWWLSHRPQPEKWWTTRTSWDDDDSQLFLESHVIQSMVPVTTKQRNHGGFPLFRPNESKKICRFFHISTFLQREILQISPPGLVSSFQPSRRRSFFQCPQQSSRDPDGLTVEGSIACYANSIDVNHTLTIHWP